MEWSHQFCLSCDKQITDTDAGSSYCSQACKIRDLEQVPHPTSYSSSRSRPSSCRSSTFPTGSGFHLPPAVNFAAYKSLESPNQQSSGTAPRVTTGRTLEGHRRNAGSSSTTSTHLTPSSSRSSLASLTSMSTTIGKESFSEEVRNELQGYFASFDQTRDFKRRRSLR